MQDLKQQRRERARIILDRCVPKFSNDDAALEHLFYVNPLASDAVRLYSIAAALHFLAPPAVPEGTAPPQTEPEVIPLPVEKANRVMKAWRKRALRAEAALPQCPQCEGTGCTDNGFMDCEPCDGTGALASSGPVERPMHSDEWLHRKAGLEEGLDVSAGSEDVFQRERPRDRSGDPQ
jgi:hypothetical protein